MSAGILRAMMRIVLVIAFKDLLLRWRDRLGFFWWMVGFPLLIAVLIGTIFAGALVSPSRPMAVAVVDEAGTTDAEAFIEALGRSEGVALQRLGRTEAHDATRRGRLAGYVVLHAGFTLSPAVLWEGRLPLAVGMDPSRGAEGSYLEACLYATALELLRGRLGVESSTLAGGARPAIESIPVDSRGAQPASAFEICFPLGIIWGLLGLTAEFAMAVVQEREAGTLLRLRVAPFSRLHVLVGGGIATFIASLGVIVLLLTVGRIAFGVRLGNPPALMLAVVCTAACFVGLSMLLSVLGKTESSVGGAAWACLLVMAMLGGGMVPQMFMPPWMDAVGYVSPVRWAILSLEGGIWRGFTLWEMCLPAGVLLAEGVVCAVAGAAILTKTER